MGFMQYYVYYCRFAQSEEDMRIGMYKILDHLKNMEDTWPFAEPVDEEYAPNYYRIIINPMDLQTMEERLDQGEYLTFHEFEEDFKLIIDNCVAYNGPNSGKFSLKLLILLNNFQHIFLILSLNPKLS